MLAPNPLRLLRLHACNCSSRLCILNLSRRMLVFISSILSRMTLCMPCSRGSAAVRSSCGTEVVVDVFIIFDGVMRFGTVVENDLEVWQVRVRTSRAGLAWIIVLTIIEIPHKYPWFRKSQRAEGGEAKNDGVKRDRPKRNSAMLNIPPRPLT